MAQLNLFLQQSRSGEVPVMGIKNIYSDAEELHFGYSSFLQQASKTKGISKKRFYMECELPKLFTKARAIMKEDTCMKLYH